MQQHDLEDYIAQHYDSNQDCSEDPDDGFNPDDPNNHICVDNRAEFIYRDKAYDIYAFYDLIYLSHGVHTYHISIYYIYNDVCYNKEEYTKTFVDELDDDTFRAHIQFN